jgi:hypothetical protein
MNHKEAFDFAARYGPSNKTREIVCQKVYFYALNIDKCPR